MWARGSNHEISCPRLLYRDIHVNARARRGIAYKRQCVRALSRAENARLAPRCGAHLVNGRDVYKLRIAVGAYAAHSHALGIGVPARSGESGSAEDGLGGVDVTCSCGIS